MAMMPPGDDPERRKPPRRPSETTYADAPLRSGEPAGYLLKNSMKIAT
jgi:hypothetical protein